MRYTKKMNRYERQEFQKAKMTRDLHGEGLYLYRNNTSGDLTLPKPDANGLRQVKKGGEFQGDNYFMGMVRSHELRLIQEIQAPEPKGEAVVIHQKLILDQPDTVTHDGKIEHHVARPAHILPARVPAAPVKPLHDGTVPVPSPSTQPDVLLTEDPLDGVDILID